MTSNILDWNMNANKLQIVTEGDRTEVIIITWINE